MELDNKNVTKWTLRGLSILCVGVFIAILLSSYYYRSLELSPDTVIRGANMGARSLLSGGQKSEPPIDMELVSRISDKLEKGQFSSPLEQFADISQITQKDFEMKNLFAAIQARDKKFEQNLGLLEQVNQQLLNSKSVLDPHLIKLG